MEMKELAALCREIGCSYQEQAPLSEYTTFRIGGPAALMLFPDSAEQVGAVIRACGGELPLFVLGRGSNLLAADEGFDGVAIHLGKNFSRIRREGDALICEAGATMAEACQAALREGLTGLEFAWGIPGSIGGGAYMNAGAYGGEFGDVVLWCEHLDENGTPGRFSGAELDYRYRHSAYTGKNLCITQVALGLRPWDPEAIREKMDDLLSRRKEKQPLEFPSAGSTFKRPEGAFAAALIEKCGLKGCRVGGAEVSEKHSGFIVNKGGATCADVLELIRQVQGVVEEKTGYRLEREVRLLGRS